MEFTSLIVKEFNITDFNLKYFVGINKVIFDLDYFMDIYNSTTEKEIIDQFFNIIDNIQNQFKSSVIQFIKEKYLLNQEHLFIACYYLQKAFFYDLNISNKKQIELLLYLSGYRQISKSISTFGINFADISKGKLLYCIISPINNLKTINDKLLQILKADETELTINIQSNEKFKLIREFFKVSENQMICILKSYGIDANSSNYNLSSKYSALYDLICERMALLNIEKSIK